MVTGTNRAQTQTHLHFLDASNPPLRECGGDQDLTVSVTLNWVEEGLHEENRWEMLIHVGWHALRFLVGKARL